MYAAAEIQSCETDLVTQVENMTSAEESRESGLVTSHQHLNSHSHLAAEEVVVDAYSHQLDSRAVEGTNSSNAILNHVNAIGRRADLEDAIIIHDPKNDATSEFYRELFSSFQGEISRMFRIVIDPSDFSNFTSVHLHLESLLKKLFELQI